MRNLLSSIWSWPYLVLTVAALFWAGNFVVGRWATEAGAQAMPPVQLAFWRWTLACILTLPFAWSALRRDLPILFAGTRRLLEVSILAALGFGAFNTLLYMGLEHSQVANAAILGASLPALVALLVWLFFRERPAGLSALGILACILAVWYAQSQGSLDAMLNFRLNPGDGFVLLATLAYALYTALLRWRPAGVSALGFLMALMLIGTLLLAPFALLEYGLRGEALPVRDPNTLLVLAYIATLPSAVAALCWNRGIQLIGAARGGVFVTLIPLGAALLGWVFLGEPLRAYHFLAFIVLVLGIALVNGLFARKALPDVRKPG